MKMFFGLVFLLSTFAIAHDGPHGPAQKMAPHGGVLRDGKSLMVELVQDASGVKLYPLTHDGKALPLKDAEVDLTKTKFLNAKKKSENVQFKPSGDAFVLDYDKASSSRHSLELVIKHAGKENVLKWQIESQTE